MKEYIDVFIVPVPKKKLAEYRKTSMGFGTLILQYGATSMENLWVMTLSLRTCLT